MSQRLAARTWTFDSSSSDAVYEVKLNDLTGLVSCDCRGWTMKRANQPRACKHTRAVVQELESKGWRSEQQDGGQFVFLGGAKAAGIPSPSAPPPLAPTGSTRASGAAPEAPTNAPGGFIKPMLAHALPDGHTVEDYGEGWVAEEKFDGVRVGVLVRGGDVRAWSRLGNARQLPAHVEQAMAGAPNGYYDAELVVQGGASWDVAAGVNSGRERLAVFDLLYCLDDDVMALPYRTRRQLLEVALSNVAGGAVFVPPHVPKTVEGLAEMWQRGAEGLMLKNAQSRYRSNHRTDQWLKVKRQQEAVLTLVGYEEGKTGPHAVAILRGDDGSQTTVKVRTPQLQELIEADPSAYVGRRVEITYQMRTPSGNYRHPIWLRLVDAA